MITILIQCRALRSVPTSYRFASLFKSMSSSASSSSSISASDVVPSGLIAVHKPKDMTSNDVVMKVRNVLQRGARDILQGRSSSSNSSSSDSTKKVKIKVGHGGTLDPLAEGVLVLGIGSGTKIMGDYLAGSKGYRAVARLGFETDTCDSTGTPSIVKDCSHVTIEALEQRLPSFTGDILQVPPMYSALKQNGKRLYTLARQGIEVERAARPVTCYRLQLVKDDRSDGTGSGSGSGLTEVTMDVQCSGGFYIRSLIQDLGRAVDGAAHMTGLVRTQQGPFELSDCIPVEVWSTDFQAICAAIQRCSSKVNLPSTSQSTIFPRL
jgi:tRNA pseudouridine55 synthase